MAMTYRQLMNNIESSEEDLKQKITACRILAQNLCFEEAQLMACRIKARSDDLEGLFDHFDFEDAEYGEEIKT